MTDVRLRQDESMVRAFHLDDRLVETPRGPVLLRTLAASGLEDEAHRLCHATFDPTLICDGHYAGYPALLVERARDPYISRVAIDVHGGLVGIYFVEIATTRKLLGSAHRYVVDVSELHDLNVLHGMSLAVEPAWRGAGVGRMLRDSLDDTRFDAVLGIATAGLGNLSHWLRHRTLVGYGRHGFVTGRGLGGRRFAFESEGPTADAIDAIVREARAIHAEWKVEHDLDQGLKQARIMLAEIARRRSRGHPFATEENARLIVETVGMPSDEAEAILVGMLVGG